MKISIQTGRFAVVAISLALASCTTTQAELSAKPHAVSNAALCKTVLETQDPQFQQQLLAELSRCGISVPRCQLMVQQQQQAAAALVAIAVVGTVAAVCAGGNCGSCGGGGSYEQYAWDEFRRPNAYGNVWACRSTSSGRFVDDDWCAGRFGDTKMATEVNRLEMFRQQLEVVRLNAASI